MNDFEILADLMLEEYNKVADDYDLPPLWSREDLLTILQDNLQEEQAERLKSDHIARMAFAGHITAIMMEVDIYVALNGSEDDDGEQRH